MRQEARICVNRDKKIRFRSNVLMATKKLNIIEYCAAIKKMTLAERFKFSLEQNALKKRKA